MTGAETRERRTAEEWADFAGQWLLDNPPPVHLPAGNRAPEDELQAHTWTQWTRDLHAAGLPQMTWPVAWGGSSAEADAALAVGDVLAAAAAPLALTDVAVNLVAPSLMRFGSPDQQARHLPVIASGEEYWTQLFSEPGAGSDLASLTTRAVRDGNEWVVRGQKVWNTYAAISHMGYLLARTGPAEGRHRCLSVFLVPMDSPGVTVRPIREATGTHDFAEVFLDDVRLAPGQLLGEVDEGWSVAMELLETERLVVGRLVAFVRAELRRLVEVLEDSSDHRAAPMLTTLGALAARANGLTSLMHDPAATAGGPMLKVLASELNLKFHRLAMDAASWCQDAPDGLVKRWHDGYIYAFGYTISGGASEVLRNVVARRSLGMPRP